MADRFTYLAGLPLAVLAAGAVVGGLARLAPHAALAGAVSIVACLAILAGLSVRQISFWHDDVALWTRPIELDPRRSGRVYTERAFAREQRGDWDGARSDMDQAIAIAAAKRYPLIHGLYSRRARILAELGSLQEAIADHGRALETDSSPGRAATLRERAALYAAAGLPDLAAADERAAEEVEGAR
jgi:tetratricopeptide (TPR) repeat protein